MTELPPYDDSFELGGLPGTPDLGDPTAGDALFADPMGPVAGPPASAEPSTPSVEPPPPPMPYQPEPRVSEPPPTYLPAGHVTYRPHQPAPSRSSRGPYHSPRTTRRPQNPVRRIIGLVIAGIVAVNLAGGLFSHDTTSTDGADPLFGRSLDNPSLDAGGVSDYNPAYADGSAVPDELVIEGTGLPNTATAVEISITPPDTARHWYRAYGDGFLLEDVMASGVYEVSYPFDAYSTIVIDGEPTDAMCAVRIDGVLAAHSDPMSSGRCVFDGATIANASPGE